MQLTTNSATTATNENYTPWSRVLSLDGQPLLISARPLRELQGKLMYNLLKKVRKRQYEIVRITVAKSGIERKRR